MAASFSREGKEELAVVLWDAQGARSSRGSHLLVAGYTTSTPYPVVQTMAWFTVSLSSCLPEMCLCIFLWCTIVVKEQSDVLHISEVVFFSSLKVLLPNNWDSSNHFTGQMKLKSPVRVEKTLSINSVRVSEDPTVGLEEQQMSTNTLPFWKKLYQMAPNSRMEHPSNLNLFHGLLVDGPLLLGH